MSSSPNPYLTVDDYGYQSFVRVAEREDSTMVMELPKEEDGSLLLSTVTGQFPDAVGLKYRSASGAWRGIRISDKVLDPPSCGWNDTLYVVTLQRSESGKRKAEDGAEEIRRPKSSKRESELLEDIIVLGLPFRCTSEDLKDYFSNECGELAFHEVKFDRNTGKARGFGFIRFKTVEGARKALNGHHRMMGRMLEVKLSKKKETPMKLFVGRIPHGVTQEELKNYFLEFGEISDTYIPPPFRGFGFVTFVSSENARLALRLNHKIKGACLNVCVAENKDELKKSGDSGNIGGKVRSLFDISRNFDYRGANENKGKHNGDHCSPEERRTQDNQITGVYRGPLDIRGLQVDRKIHDDRDDRKLRDERGMQNDHRIRNDRKMGEDSWMRDSIGTQEKMAMQMDREIQGAMWDDRGVRERNRVLDSKGTGANRDLKDHMGLHEDRDMLVNRGPFDGVLNNRGPRDSSPCGYKRYKDISRGRENRDNRLTRDDRQDSRDLQCLKDDRGSRENRESRVTRDRLDRKVERKDFFDRGFRVPTKERDLGHLKDQQNQRDHYNKDYYRDRDRNLRQQQNHVSIDTSDNYSFKRINDKKNHSELKDHRGMPSQIVELGNHFSPLNQSSQQFGLANIPSIPPLNPIPPLGVPHDVANELKDIIYQFLGTAK